MSSIDFDPAIKLCLKYLHSSAPDSTEQLRLTLDDYIRQTYGSSKTLGNVLPKKYLNEEKSESVRSKHKNEKASSSKTIPIPQQSPQQIQIPERENDDSSVMDGELAFDLLEEDLTCVVCRQIAVQAGNRLVECDVCHSLYHQDCHKPVISDSDMGTGWQCQSCITMHGFSGGFSSKSSSASKSPPLVSGSTTPVKISSSSSASSSPSKVVTPSINIISADKRLQIMKKKAAKQHEKKKGSK
ncbi:integrator complex subunit 12 isoform X1 [Plodia interpunctella]|uniref:integrator complex subunit 12 isoform X1 n=1 Tax=Plodia interpunctella TaxID=58824 RepID=UPI0023677FA9|nr:integrator complex subunit 12 isoform X1 [Plodia interpunctella]